MQKPSLTTSPYWSRIATAISRATAEDRDELMAFRLKMYGPESAYADPRWVRWMYDQSPVNRKLGCPLWVYRDGGVIAGQQGAIRTRIKVEQDELDLCWALDLMVTPELRTRGIGAVLPGKVLAEAELTVGTEVSEAAQKAFSRAGWSHLGTLPLWVRPIAAKPFLRARAPKLPSGFLHWPLSFAEKAFSAYSHTLRLHRRLSGPSEFDARADEVWKHSSPGWPIIARRDADWLNWRWNQCPRRDNATIHWLERGGDVVGWVVLRAGEHRGVRAGFIVDLLAPPGELPALFSLAVNHLRREGVAVVYCLFNAPGAERALKLCGFLHRDSGLAWMINADKLPEATAELVKQPRRWFITAGDSDLDRPRDRTVFA